MQTKTSKKIVALILSVMMVISVMVTGFVAPANAAPTSVTMVLESTLGNQFVTIAELDSSNMIVGVDFDAKNDALCQWDNFSNSASKCSLKPGKKYLVSLATAPNAAGSWFFIPSKSAIITVAADGAVTVTGGTATGAGSAVTSSSTVYYEIEAGKGGSFYIRDVAAAKSTMTLSAADLGFTSVTPDPDPDPDPDAVIGVTTPGKVYNATAAISNSKLQDWAKLKVDLYKTAEGGDKQGFSYNSLKESITKNGTPARSEALEFKQQAVIDYYKEVRVNNDSYVVHDSSPIAGQEYFLHDYYLQGIWDAMPAYYGWSQDEYTEPGVIPNYLASNGLMQGENGNYSANIKNKSYANSLGGNNPWFLLDHIEKNAANAPTVINEFSQGNEVVPAGGIDVTANKWYYGYDEKAACPYLWNPNPTGEGNDVKGGAFLTYENPLSIKTRSDYIKEKGLAGVIIWEMSGDSIYDYPMMQIFNQELRQQGKQVIGYFTNWSVYNQYHQQQSVEQLPYEYMTYVNYSFFQIGGYAIETKQAKKLTDNVINSMDTWADDWQGLQGGTPPSMLNKIPADRKGAKILASVGGWTRGDGFYQMVNSEANRNTFANSCAAFVAKYKLDGIDLDWEYSGKWREADFDDPADLGSAGKYDDDFGNYIKLIQKLREVLPNGATITACAPAAPSNIELQDIVAVADNCDFLNVMTYDYHGAFDPVIGYNNPLYTPSSVNYQGENYYGTDATTEFSTANTVDFLLSKGVPAAKINIGAGFYSRGWAGIKADENGIPMGIQDETPFGFDAVQHDDTITVTLDKTTVKSGEKVQATAKVSPDSTKEVTWTISGGTGATIDQNGLVSTTAAGTYTVTAALKDDATVSDSKTFTVTAADVTTITVKLDKSTVQIPGTVTATATVSPDNSKAVTWSITGGTGATISSSGVVTVTGTGTYTVTATLVEDSTIKGSATFNATEEPVPDLIFSMRLNSQTGLLNRTEVIVDNDVKTGKDPVTPFTINGRTMLPVRSMEQLGAEVTYIDQTSPITVVRDGITLTLTVGQNSMTKKDATGATSTISLEVPATYVDGKTYLPFRALCEALNLSVEYVEEVSGDKRYVIVVSNRVLTAAELLEEVEAAHAVLPYNVKGISAISAKTTSYTIGLGERVRYSFSDINVTLSAQGTGSVAGCQYLLYSSSNPAVIEATSQGHFIARAAGTATITISSHNGKTTTVTVTAK